MFEVCYFTFQFCYVTLRGLFTTNTSYKVAPFRVHKNLTFALEMKDWRNGKKKEEKRRRKKKKKKEEDKRRRAGKTNPSSKTTQGNSSPISLDSLQCFRQGSNSAARKALRHDKCYTRKIRQRETKCNIKEKIKNFLIVTEKVEKKLKKAEKSWKKAVKS